MSHVNPASSLDEFLIGNYEGRFCTSHMTDAICCKPYIDHPCLFTHMILNGGALLWGNKLAITANSWRIIIATRANAIISKTGSLHQIWQLISGCRRLQGFSVIDGWAQMGIISTLTWARRLACPTFCHGTWIYKAQDARRASWRKALSYTYLSHALPNRPLHWPHCGSQCYCLPGTCDGASIIFVARTSSLNVLSGWRYCDTAKDRWWSRSALVDHGRRCTRVSSDRCVHCVVLTPAPIPSTVFQHTY